MVVTIAARLLLALPPWPWLVRMVPADVVRQAIQIARTEQSHALQVKRLLLEIEWLKGEIEEATRDDQGH